MLRNIDKMYEAYKTPNFSIRWCNVKRYVLKRILIAIPTFIGITILVFGLCYTASGSPLELLLNNQNISEAEVLRQAEKLGLNQPVYMQYLLWMKNFLSGNLGISYRTSGEVLPMIMNALWPTVLLTLSAVLVACIISFPLGIQSACHQNGAWDNVSSVFSFLSTSTPSFFLALVFLYLFSVQLGILPIGGMYDTGKSTSILSLLRHLVMPATVLGSTMVGSLIQYTRSSMLEVMREDYVRTAYSKGLRNRVVIFKHVLRNSLIPVATYLGMEIPMLIGGAVVTEQVFSWPGLGNLMLKSISARDYPVIMGVTIVTAIAVLVFNLLTDLFYGVLDPRIRYN